MRQWLGSQTLPPQGLFLPECFLRCKTPDERCSVLNPERNCPFLLPGHVPALGQAGTGGLSLTPPALGICGHTPCVPVPWENRSQSAQSCPLHPPTPAFVLSCTWSCSCKPSSPWLLREEMEGLPWGQRGSSQGCDSWLWKKNGNRGKMKCSYSNKDTAEAAAPKSPRFSSCFMGHVPRELRKVLSSLSSQMLKITNPYENDSTLTLT